MQRRQRHDPSTTVDAYLERCALKTGKLFAAACVLGGGSGEFGRLLGISFQIVDDILDCAGETIETGKIPGTDLRDGTPTLPLLLAAREDEVVRAALAGGPLEGALVRVAATGALERSLEVGARLRCASAREPGRLGRAGRSSKRSPTPSSSGTADSTWHRWRHEERRVIRLGRISYVNMAPVFHRLTHEVEEVTGVPTTLNRMLLDGEIDVAPISSIEYARNAPRAAAAAAALRVVRGGRRLDPARHAHVARPDPHGRGHAGERDVGRADEGADPAGRAPAARGRGRSGRKASDRRRRAQERVRGPDAASRPRPSVARAHRAAMVFAVWAAPEPLVDGLGDLQDALVASVRLARSEPERLAYEASERYGYPPGFLARYFEKLRYSFGPRERAGFYTFLEMARDVGELAQVPELRFIPGEPARVSGREPASAGGRSARRYSTR